MGPDASLRTILNIYSITDNDEAYYLWQPKEDITTNSEGYIDTSYYSAIHGKQIINPNTQSANNLRNRKISRLEFHKSLNGASGCGGVTADQIARMKIDPKIEETKPMAMTPAKIIDELNYAVIVEPIIWSRLRKNYGTSDDWTQYVVYGTQTNIAEFINMAENAGILPKSASGWNYGGVDVALFGRAGRKAMYLTENINFPALIQWRDGVPHIEYDLTLKAPPDAQRRVIAGSELDINNDDMRDRTLGWGMHIFYGGTGGNLPYTVTFDKVYGGINPHPAPDPSLIPIKPGEDVSLRNINIVKTYMEGDEHIGTYSRNNNPGTILIQDEIIYKVEEWFVSPDYIETEEGTTWEEITSRTSKSLNGTHSNAVRVMEPDTTLYVKLVVKPPKVGEAVLEITESQITKAVETIDSNIPNWGAKTMNFNYQSLSGTCDHKYYCEGCSGRNSHLCFGHRCGNSFVLSDTDYDYHFKNIAPIKEKLLANVGVFKALNTTGDDASGNRSSLSAGTDGVSSFNYQMVLWRGKDVPTLASYKENSSHVLNTLLSRYGKQPVGSRTNERVYFDSLDIELDMDNSIGDYSTDSECPKHSSPEYSSYGLRSTAKNSNKLQYNGDVTILSYTGVQHKIGNAVTSNNHNIFATLVGKSVTPKFSGGTIVPSSKAVKFYPYIRMTYQLPAAADDDRIDVNVLSQWVSELHPSSYAEATWGSTKDLNMNIASAQWSTHQRAVVGSDGWQGSNKVLPGGSIFTLDTKNQNTYASVITWQPYLEDEIANNVIIEGGSSYKLSDTVAPHDDLVKSAEKALDNWRVVQYVEKNTKATNAFGGLKVAGGNIGLSSLGLTGKSSTDDKYYYKPAGQGEVAGQGDLDIINKTYTEIHYKVSANTEGDVKIHRKRDSSGWVLIDTIKKNEGIEVLSDKSKALDDRTKVVTNLLTVLTRNEGNDKTASWATSDGKWYNEAFDGICYVRRETSFEVGFVNSSIRSSALDPNLSPPNKGQSDLFSTAFISQFRLNDKSDAYTSEAPGYVGKFKGQNVILPGAENMYKTRVFSIPNVNVQDLK